MIPSLPMERKSKYGRKGLDRPFYLSRRRNPLATWTTMKQHVQLRSAGGEASLYEVSLMHLHLPLIASEKLTVQRHIGVGH